MTRRAGSPVVAGVDGSARGLDAVEVGCAEAALHHRPLRIVHAMTWPAVPVARPPGTTETAPLLMRSQADAFLADAVRLAAKAEPTVTVTSAVLHGAAVLSLVAESRSAYLIVVGDRGLGAFAGLLVGSTAVQLAAHAACPVLVVRGEHRRTGPVVVGVDGSATSVRALDFAVEEAARRETDLVAVHTWRAPAVPGPVGMMPMAYDPPLVGAEEKRVLAESLAGIGGSYPDVTVQREAVPGAPAKVLTDWSHRGQLMVVGNRGRGGLAGLLLGSVSQHLIHHAACPVAVVRAARS
jgi:nucleotide-binding universal stress UspA family protein